MILSLYLPYIRLRKRSWQVDERILRQHILPTFARHPLQDISRNDVEIWLGLLAAKGLAPATCNRILSVFKTSVHWRSSGECCLFHRAWASLRSRPGNCGSDT